MAAPDSTLLAALRSKDRPVRHLFFRMEHDQGTVLAWDGVGNFVYNAETYSGVGGMASIGGVSRSRDLQTEEIVVTLSGVPYEALQVTNPDIRNKVATITAVWLAEDGSQVASLNLFTGLGNFLTSAFGERTISLTAHLRGRMADWAKAPQSYYTSQEQDRLYPGDTGFDAIKTLENTVVSGWGQYAESTGAVPRIYQASSGVIVATLLQKAMGSDVSGPFVFAVTGPVVRWAGTSDNLKSETELDDLAWTADSPGFALSIAGQATYVDIDGFMRTSEGLRVSQNGTDTSNYVRTVTAPTSNGSPTATTFSLSTGYTTDLPVTTGTGALSQTTNPERWKEVVFAASGLPVRVNGGNVQALVGGLTQTQVVEETTGNNVTYSGGLMVCNGNNVVLSDTGVLLTSSGNRIYPTGEDVDKDFLRVWT